MNQNLSFQQLDMFKPARELRGMHLSDVQSHIWNRGGGLDYQKTAKVVMARKVREAKRSGLHEDIKQKGVQEPVSIVNGHPGFGSYVADGHHRVASAMSIDPNMLVPVTHSKW
jgi:hypothetical protein